MKVNAFFFNKSVISLLTKVLFFVNKSVIFYTTVPATLRTLRRTADQAGFFFYTHLFISPPLIFLFFICSHKGQMNGKRIFPNRRCRRRTDKAPAKPGMHIEDSKKRLISFDSKLLQVLRYRFIMKSFRTYTNSSIQSRNYLQQVVYLHEFDSKFRTLLFSCIEHIEIAFRTAICLELSLRYKNGHWYLDKALYDPNRFKYDEFIADCRKEFNRSREVFSTAYKENYSKPELPPCWMLRNPSIGKWSKLSAAARSFDQN